MWFWMFVVWGCAGTGGEPVEPADCAGPHVGTYTGDDEGVVTGELLADGTLEITFGTSFGDVDAEAFVEDDGVVTGTEGTVSVEGTYDGPACTAAGAWIDVDNGFTGTWQLELL